MPRISPPASPTRHLAPPEAAAATGARASSSSDAGESSAMGALRQRRPTPPGANAATPEEAPRPRMQALPLLRQAAGNVASAGASAGAALTSAGAGAGAAIASAGATAGAALVSAGETAATAATAAASMAGRAVVAAGAVGNSVLGLETPLGMAMVYQGFRGIAATAEHMEEPSLQVWATFAVGLGVLAARPVINAALATEGLVPAAEVQRPARAEPAPRSPAVLEALVQATNTLTGQHDSVDLRHLPMQVAVRIGDHFMDYRARTTVDPRVDHAIESAGLDPRRIVDNVHALVTAQPPVLSRRETSAAGRR